NGKKLDEAKKVAAAADVVVCVVGYTHKDEGEYLGPGLAGDRDQLGLHAKDVDLIKAIAPENPHTVVVLIGSSAILMEEWQAAVPPTGHAFYGGMDGGTAIANVLFGEVTPSGKLPLSIPTHVRHLPPFDKNADHFEYARYHGYPKLKKEGNRPAF